MTFHTLQNGIFPKVSLCTECDLYFRFHGHVDLDLKQSILTLNRKDKIFTDTYFNSISIGKWKRHTHVSDLFFQIRFQGRLKISWHRHRLHHSFRTLDAIYLDSSEETELTLPLPFWVDLDDGMLFFEAEAQTRAKIFSFSYVTSQAPIHDIKLGIVITHFNRQQYVLPAIARLKEELLDIPAYQNQVSLHVVDNSSNLPQIANVNIIPNENLGGSGGFSRGLMHLRNTGHYTHCLFMDDDASCEVEGIKRTLALLAYATDPKQAVAGAMLREVEPFRQFENGARFDGLCRPVKRGLDLRQIHDLLINEQEEPIDYGGWWFFAFPLDQVQHYAFPFFVRGDDISFGLSHKFNIITLNSISSWQDDFSLKNGPLPFYLDTRNNIVQYLHGHFPNSKWDLIKLTAEMVFRNLFSYQYETGLAAVCAMEDVQKGKSFWEDNTTMVVRRREILQIIVNEKLRDIPFHLHAMAARPGAPRELLVHRWMRWLTLNGHLLPRFLFKNGRIWQEKGFGGNLREIFRHPEVLYIHWPSNQGFLLKHDKKQFFTIVKRYGKAAYGLFRNYERLQKEYQDSYAELTSEKFWRKQFKNDY